MPLSIPIQNRIRVSLNIEIQEEHPIIKGLIAEGAYYPFNVVNGVGNVFKNIVPDIGYYKEYISSIYAREAYKAAIWT